MYSHVRNYPRSILGSVPFQARSDMAQPWFSSYSHGQYRYSAALSVTVLSLTVLPAVAPGY